MFHTPRVVWSNGGWERRDLLTHSGQIVQYTRAKHEDPEITATAEALLIHGEFHFSELHQLRVFQEILARAWRQHLKLKFGNPVDEPEFMDGIPPSSLTCSTAA